MAEIKYLDDLLDVKVPTPADNDVLYWDAATSLWKCKQPPTLEAIVERLARVSADDIEVHWNGAAWVASIITDAWWVGYFDGSYQKMGGAGRFLNIYIPSGVTILEAYLKPTCRTSDASTGVKSRLRGEKDINPATFSTYANYDARTRTTAQIDWDDIPSWTLGTQYQSPDIKTIIQEIINLVGWTSGNPIVIFWDDHEARTATDIARLRRARSWDHASRTPPMLYVKYEA